jgi:hypothetical protein
MALLRRAADQPELYCGKPVPARKPNDVARSGKSSSGKSRTRKSRSGKSRSRKSGGGVANDGDDAGDDDDDDDDDDEGESSDGAGPVPVRAPSTSVHGVTVDATVAHERPGKDGAHLFRVDLKIANRGRLTVQATAARAG